MYQCFRKFFCLSLQNILLCATVIFLEVIANAYHESTSSNQRVDISQKKKCARIILRKFGKVLPEKRGRITYYCLMQAKNVTNYVFVNFTPIRYPIPGRERRQKPRQYNEKFTVESNIQEPSISTSKSQISSKVGPDKTNS